MNWLSNWTGYVSANWVIFIILAILIVGLYRSNTTDKDYCGICMGRNKNTCDECANCTWGNSLLGGEGCRTDVFGLLR